MKAQRRDVRVVLFFLAGALAALAAQAQLGPGPFAAFPSQSATDGRFLGFGCAGLATFEQNVQIALAAPASTATFDLNVFDGDTGGLDTLNRRHWDLGTRQLKFSLYADPTRSGSTAPGNLIGQWFGNSINPLAGPSWTASSATMPDNAWWAVTVTNPVQAQAPSGNYFYNLVIETDGACGVGEQLESNLKIAASNPMNFRTPRFGLVGGLRQTANDVPIIYPGSTPAAPVTGSFLTAPTTYDGTFEFFFTLPGGETELRLFDGDFDYGTSTVVGNPSGIPLDPCFDQDDPDTDPLYAGFPFNTTGAVAEGSQGPGSPPDDNFRDIFRRGELGDPGHIGCVRYEVTDPEGNVYFNDNPSGSFEWEQFLIASASSSFAGNADWVFPGTTLPGGIWSVKIIGLDLANLNFWFADTCATRPARDPLPGENPDNVPRVPACSDEATYLLGDFVWSDTDGDAVLDAGESGIPGVLMELVRPSDGAVIATAKTGDTTAPNWAACVANNTGTDTNGLYCFGMDSSGTYEVRVAASNFDPGQPLEGQSSTTGGETLTRTLSNANVLTYDFGYNASANASLGDRVWLDDDGDGVQDAGETGIDGVTVELLSSGGTTIASQTTAGDGNYSFTGLQAGTYSVRVVAATLPVGLAQTYDLDGTGSANVASATLATGENRTDVDFGYRGTASVGDRVWTDTDGDGVQDAGETGINGVTVELLDSGGTVVATQTTSGDGNYSFTNLAAGSYSVRVVAATLPAGYAATYDLDGVGTVNVAAFTLAGGENRTDVDFGYRGTASVGDRVWIDTNGDGIQDLGETGINGVTVELLNAGGTVIATQATSGDGNYTFSNLAAGSYSVRVVGATLPVGLAQTYDLDGTGTANLAAFSLTAGQNRTDVDFGYRGTASVGDRIWTDSNGDGVQDAGETGINGVTVELLNSGGTVIASQTTSGDGNYTFSNLTAGNYSVRVVAATLPAGVAQTYDLDGVGTANAAAFALAAGQNRTDVDFGYRGTASVGDRVWIDTDGDGVQDAGETGINGVTVELLNSGGTVIASQTTSGDGNYTFSNLVAGNYSVRVVTTTLPAGLAQTYDLDGVGTANAAAFALAAGQNRTDVDFGYRGTGSVGDRVWTDKDGNGVQDAGEPGINGATVELIDSGGTVIATQTTSGDGNYLFSNLTAGNYSVRVVAGSLPAGLTQTYDLNGVGTPNVAAFSLAAAQNRTDVDFGYRGTASAGDRVWIDTDGDGVQDAGETGINGVTVELLNSGGTVIASQTTSGDGNYLFTNLTAGNYSVRVVAATLPAGVAQTFDLDGTGTANVAAFALTAGQNRTDVDFGYRGTASVGDRVWLDADADGLQDAGETGINGVTVELLNSGGTVIATRTTSGDGNYTFSNLTVGNYSVRVVAATLPAGVAQTYDLDGIGTANVAAFALAAGQNRTDVDFGYRNTASVGDRVWLDADADGVQDAGETGINGVTVELLSSGGTVIASQATSGDGNYSFTNLAAGNYSVRVVTATLPAGLAQTYDLDGVGTANLAAFSLTAGQNRTDVDFGYRGTASVGDRVWNDANGNGVQDGGETGINGVTVELLNAGGTVVASRVTAGDGNYSFTNLLAGTYSVRVVTSTLPAGMAQTYDLDGVGTAHLAAFPLAAGQNRTDVDFGYRVPPTGSIGDRVWNDVDGDGVQDAGEAGLNGVTVRLLDAANNVIATQVTSGNGNYTFAGLIAGSYSVVVDSTTLPSGYGPTFDLDGTATAHRAAVTLATNQVRTDVDFGYRSSDTETCAQGAYANPTYSGATGGHAFWLPNIGTDFQFAPATGSFVQHADGTARLTGIVRRVANPSQAFVVDVTFSGFTMTAPPNSPKKELLASAYSENGGPVNTATFKYYATFTGKLTGIESFAGAVITITPAGPAFQIGYGANSKNILYGGSGWFLWTVVSQPSSGSSLSTTGQGDINVDLGSCTSCANEANNNPAVQAASANHAFWLPGIGTDFQFAPTDGTFVRNADGTAHLTGTLYSVSAPTHGFTVDVTFSGFTATAGAGSPKKELAASAYSENGGPVNTASWTYYKTFTGTLTGVSAYAGASITITNTGPAFQMGVGANNKNLNFGGSGWYLWTVTSQPTSGSALTASGQGDINIDMFDCQTVSYGSVGNRVWNDVDGDGVQDTGEAGLNGVTVRLVDTVHAVTVGTATTSGDGAYTFANVVAGSYRVEVVTTSLPAGYTRTYDLDGISSANVASFTLSAGQNRTDVDFGYRASTCTAGYAKDTFTTASFSNNEGTISWAGAWIEYDTAGAGVGSGNVTVGTPYSGYLQIHDSPDTGTQPSAARQVSLTGFASATLQFAFHTTSGVDADDAVAVEISKDGGATYTVLETINGITGSTTGSRSYNVSSYISGNTRIRFRVSSYYGVSDEYFKVDWVKVDGACAP